MGGSDRSSGQIGGHRPCSRDYLIWDGYQIEDGISESGGGIMWGMVHQTGMWYQMVDGIPDSRLDTILCMGYQIMDGVPATRWDTRL